MNLYKKLYLVIGCWVLGTFSSEAQQVVRTVDFANCPTDIETLNFEVLDANLDKNLILYKHTYRIMEIENEEGEIVQSPCECKYAGMDEMSSAGVLLATYNLKTDKPDKSFFIYESVSDCAKCTKHEVSEENLAEAKAYFSSNELKSMQRLDIKTFGSSGIIDFPNGRKLKVTTVCKSAEDDTDLNRYKVICTLSINEVEMFVREFAYNAAMGGTATIAFEKYFIINNSLVFIEKYDFNSGMLGNMHREFYGFSPVIDLEKF